jgi:predicted DNA-binding protein
MKVKLSARIDEDIKARLKKAAKKRGYTSSYMVNEILKNTKEIMEETK